MVDRIGKKEFIRRLAARMETNEASAAIKLDAVFDTLYESLKAGESVTISGFGSFYVRPHRDTWVFKFNPGQKLRSALRWSSTYKGEL